MEKPTLPKGTRDFGPLVMARRQYILDHIRAVFHLYGFQPLETPAMENLSVLTGKYGEEGDQLLFRILNSGDFLKDADPSQLAARDTSKISASIAEKGLRYDLTVPFARFVVANRHALPMPFKRYQIQPVWRADRPQKGRYREFYQCDADVVGTDSLVCETEVILMIKNVFSRLGIHRYQIKINHRGLLSAIAAWLDAGAKEAALFTAIDKLEKIGRPGVTDELTARGFDPPAIERLFNLLDTHGDTDARFEKLAGVLGTFAAAGKALDDLRQVRTLLRQYGETDEHVEFDLALARGLTYYTGTIFEVKIADVAVGSVSGGGRYDNLTQAFGAKERLTGIGISFGVDRIYDAMEELKAFPDTAGETSQALVCHLDQPSMDHGLGVLSQLRKAGIPAEIYPDLAKIKKQLDYANRKSIPFAIVIGSEEMDSGLLVIKDMRAGTQQKLPLADWVSGWLQKQAD